MKSYLDCWIGVAASLFAQALTGAPELVESLPMPLTPGSFGFAATLVGEPQGRFSVVLDGAILEAPLLGEGVDQKESWRELLREVADAAAGELLASCGLACRVTEFEDLTGESQVTRAFQLRSGERAWTVLVRDDVRSAEPLAREGGEPGLDQTAEGDEATSIPRGGTPPIHAPNSRGESSLQPGIELLLDVELETSLRFGCREMPLGEILDLGPGDVVQLDRHLTEPVDLIVSDKIVARGEVVLVNGNFGLRITEVATPTRRLEAIRCLF